MGRKSSTETLSAILLAFLERRTWNQKALADRCEVSVKTLKRHLTDLVAAGFHIDRDDNRDPPHVFWTVPKDWFPGAVVFRGERLKDLARVLQNGPRSEARRRLLAQVASGASGLRLAEVVIADELPPEQEVNLWTIEDCVARRIAVHMRYHTMERGDASYRHASVHRVVLGDVIRLVGTCHRDDKLKWFRLDNVWWARPDDTESFRSCPHGALASFVSESLDGFHSGHSATECRFRVRLPEARWVKAQISFPATIEEGSDEYVFTVKTAGVLALARFVVGLGAAARSDSRDLRTLVEELARGAIGP